MDTHIHLIVGPREYVGLQAQGVTACDVDGRLAIPMRQRTRDPGKATCPACATPGIAEAAEARAVADYRSRLAEQTGGRR